MVDYRGIVALAVKLLGLWLIVHGVTTFAQVFPRLVGSALSTDLILMFSAWVLVPVLFGSLLWLFPRRLANTIVHPGLPPDGVDPDWAVKLEQVGMSLLGVFLLFQALSGLASHVTLYRADIEIDLYAPRDLYPAVVGRLVQVAVALLLVLRSHGIVNALARLRGAGTRRSPAGPP
jgi:hypothetical protein